MLYRKTKLVDQQRQELLHAIEDVENSDLSIDDEHELCEYAEILLKGFDMAVSGFMPVNDLQNKKRPAITRRLSN